MSDEYNRVINFLTVQMKKVLFVILLALGGHFCFTGNLLGQTINTNYPEETLASRINRISKDFGVTISFDSQTVRNTGVPALKTKGGLEQVLSNTLETTSFTYQRVSGNSYIIVKGEGPRPVEKIRVSGVVTDKEDNSTLIGVNVVTKGTRIGTSTDLDGHFSLEVPRGTVLEITYIGFLKKEVRVDQARNDLVIELQNSNQTIGEVTVMARRQANTEVSVLQERQNSSVVQDAISAIQIQRMGSITTAQALEKVSGVTVTDDKYVAIRGLGDRSVIGELNGIRLASSDPDRSTIPLDLVPAALLDNVTVYKTVSPDKPADAASGIVELKTKSVPDSLTLVITAQTGFNTNIGIGGKYNSFWNSKMGFLGTKINNKDLKPDFLDLPKQYPGGLGDIQNLIANSGYNQETMQEVNRINGIMQGFDPVLTTRYEDAHLNQMYSITFGNSYPVFGKHRIGIILGANYYSRTTDINDGDLTQYSIFQGVVTGNPDIFSNRHIPNYITPNTLVMGKYQTYKENTGTETLNYGILGGLTYRFGPRHEISMQYLSSWGGETEATNMYGGYEYTDLPGDVKSTIYSLKQTFRKLRTFNLQGEHKFLAGKYSPRLSYNLATSKASHNNPDYRFVSLADYTPEGGAWYLRPVPGVVNQNERVHTYHLYSLVSGYVNGFGPYGIIQAEPNGRRWRELEEENYNYKADLSLPFPLFGQYQELKLGANYLNRDRDFTENILFLPGSNFSSQGPIPLYEVEGDLNRLVSSEVIGVQVPDGTTGEGAVPVGGFLYNTKKSPNNYEGYFETIAFYGMLDFKPFDNLRLTGGVRFEKTNIQSVVDEEDIWLDPSLTTTDDEGNVIPIAPSNPVSGYETDYKPYYSVNTTYMLNKSMNFRAAFNTTLARPDLRELTNIFEFDAFQMGLVVGNPDLINQHNENLDFRWEWFPNPGEVIAVSAFGKRIKNQLEKVFSLRTQGVNANYPEFPTIRFQNDPNTGKVWGLELELVKNLGTLWAPARDFFLGANLLLAQSDIDKTEERLTANRQIDRHAPKNSPLFEQAPYSVNAWLNYNNPRSGTDLTATFNMVGERLVQINLTGEPDLYTRPVPTLDFVFSQRLNKHFLFKGYAKNILDPDIKTVYANPRTGGKWYGTEYVNRSYKKGCEIMLGITYNLH